MLSATTRLLKHMPLALQALLLTLGIGALVWLALDIIQGRELRETFLAELTQELSERAKEDRLAFDRQVKGIHSAAKLIVEQKHFWDYINSREWIDGPVTAEPVHHQELPPWLPRASILRTFFHAQHALLIDNSGKTREIYHHIPHDEHPTDLTATLVHPSELLQLLSHNQAYMTSVEGAPTVIAVRQAIDTGELKATLMLVSPIDSEFLFQVQRHFGSKNILAMLDPKQGLVIASSNQELVPTGLAIDALEKDFILMGKANDTMPLGSFFDYGASDLELNFVSLVPTAKAEQMADIIHHKNSQQRILLVAVLVVVFFLLILGMVHRIRALTHAAISFTKSQLGGTPLEIMKGDELSIMEQELKHLSNEVVQSQARIQAHADEKVELIRQAAEGEQRKRELDSLRSVTETLGIGIIFDGDEGPVAFNSLMENFAQHCGGLDRFLQIDANSSSELILKDDDGSNRTFVVNRHDSLGDQGMLVHDVTLTRQIEHSRRQLMGILDQATDFVASADTEGNILYINKGGRRLIGIGEDEEIIGASIANYHPPEVFQRIHNEGLSTAKKSGAWIGETTLLTRQGTEIPVSQVILSHQDSQGKVEYYSTIARDISQQKEMEQELKAAFQTAKDANQAKSQFLANMSHEIRTPMQAIIGMADMLEETTLDEHQTHLVATLEQAGNGLLEIVNNILDLSKIEAGKFELQTEPFALSTLIKGVARICSFKAKEKGLNISTTIDPNAPTQLVGDRTLLQQVLINLIDNAIKFTYEGSIQVSVIPDPSCSCRNISGNSSEPLLCRLQFSVTDTGIGMSDDTQRKIFKAFTQADTSTSRVYGGTGLGTTISKHIVEKMGGKIWIESKTGVGSTFYFTAKFDLPPTEVVETPTEIPAHESPPQEKALNILLAEDSEDIRLLIQAYLQSTNYRLDIAVNGAEAVERYQASPYDLILMDMEMPVKDGYTATREIRGLEQTQPDHKPTPIIALTAHALAEHAQHSLKAGCTAHATKPIKKKQLLQLISDYTA